MMTTVPPPQMEDAEAPVTADRSVEVPFWRSWTILAFALVILISYWLNPPTNLAPQSGVEMTLPTRIGHFSGLNSPISDVELSILPKDTEFARKEYDDFRGHVLLGSIILSGAEQRSIHRPEVCLVAQGWTIAGQDDVPITLASGHRLTVRNLTLQRTNLGPNNERIIMRAYFMYWFVGGGVTTPSNYMRIFKSAWDRVVHNRAHRWAYVSYLSLIPDSAQPGSDEETQTRDMLLDFIRQSVPSFQKSEMADQADR